MSHDKKTPTELAPDQGLQWRLYDQLNNTLQHYHLRWVDHFRVLLTFNGFLLPAAGALTGYALQAKPSSDVRSLLLFVPILCLVGIAVTVLGLLHLVRIRIDTNLKYHQLRDLEHEFQRLPRKPFLEGEAFFRRHENVQGKFGAEDLVQPCKPKLQMGMKAISSYGCITGMVVVGYLCLLIFALVMAS